MRGGTEWKMSPYHGRLARAHRERATSNDTGVRIKFGAKRSSCAGQAESERQGAKSAKGNNAKGDPVFTAFVKHHSQGAHSMVNDPELDSLIEQATAATGDERTKLWQQVFARANDAIITDISDTKMFENLENDQKIKRLFPDYVRADLGLYKETGIYTPVHMIVMSRRLDRRSETRACTRARGAADRDRCCEPCHRLPTLRARAHRPTAHRANRFRHRARRSGRR